MPPVDPFLRKQPWHHRGLGPAGRKLCFCGCGQEVGPKRSSSAGPACVRAWKSHSDLNHIKFLIHQRDKGRCALCGADTKAAQDEYRRALVAFGESVRGGYSAAYRNAWPRTAQQVKDVDYSLPGFPRPPEGFPADLNRRWWEADHIVPVVEGGGGCDFNGYRTLCIPCHRAETKRLAGRLATKRRAEKEAMTPTLQLT